MTTNQAIGKPVPRTDGEEKVTGATKYTADVALPGTLWAKVLRSPVPHARIASIDVARARAMPGVVAVLSGRDVGRVLCGRWTHDLPVLAHEVVRFVGEPVVAVAAVDEETAERALAAVSVEYAELPAVFDALAAVEPGAPVLHAGAPNYKGMPKSPPGSLAERAPNVYVTRVWGAGDVEAGFAEADVVLEETYTTAVVHQAYLEPHACLVDVEPGGDVHVWASNKTPHHLKRHMAEVLGLAEKQVHVHHVGIGGDFGGKGLLNVVFQCYFLSKASGRPVRMVLDYAEELAAGNPRHPAQIRIKAGARRTGEIVACHIEGYFNTGAYSGFTPLGFLPGPRHAAGCYRIPHCKVEVHHVYTNKPPSGYMRGPGEPQAIFAMESHVDAMARALGIDPAEMRLRNIIRDGDANGLGEAYGHLHGAETLEAALEASGYWSEKAPNVGRGVAIGERTPGGGETHVSVTFQHDGTVLVLSTIFEQGTGTYTMIRQVVADTLGLPLEWVTVRNWHPDDSGFDMGAGASRFTRIGSQAAAEAATEARTKLLAFVAESLGCEPRELSLGPDGVRRVTGGPLLGLTDVVARSPKAIGGYAHVNDLSPSHVTAFTAQVAEVSVDRETGQVKLLKLTSVHDAGRVINPIGHDGQIYGGVMQGVGFGLTEEIAIVDGRAAVASFADYKVPSIADIPSMQAITIESNDGVGPLNIKGIGENPISPVAPAIANAIADAAGVRIRDLPLTAERVYRALRGRG